MIYLSLVLAFLLLASAAAANDKNQLSVTFRPDTPKSFVSTLVSTFRLKQLKQVNAQTYVFQIPALKTQEQYVELFASLPAVQATDPVPAYKIADHIHPQAIHVQPVPDIYNPATGHSAQAYVPNEMLVKFKDGVSADDIRFINSHHGVSQLSRIAGIDVYRLRLPQNLGVEEAMALYNQHDLVEYAEPNYTMSLPSPVNPASPNPDGSSPAQLPAGPAVITQIPLDGGGQMLVYFKPGTSQQNIALFHRIYGTQQVKKQSFYAYRVQLPAGLNPSLAARTFKLFPHITNVQRLYA